DVLVDVSLITVGAVLGPVLIRERVAVVAGRVGATPRLGEERFPPLVRQTAALPVGAGVLAAMVEEADIVVGLLERLDLALDELVQLDEVLRQIFRNGEVHRSATSRRIAARASRGTTRRLPCGLGFGTARRG